MNKTGNQERPLPEKLQMVVDKSGISANEIASLIYHWKNDEIRFREQTEKDNLRAIKDLSQKVQLRKLIIEDHETLRKFNEIFSPAPPPTEPIEPPKPNKKFNLLSLIRR